MTLPTKSKQQVKRVFSKLSKKATAVSDTVLPVKPSPDKQLGELFRDVQMSRISSDSKTFVDAIPNQAAKKIIKAYEHAQADSDFDLKRFVHDHFTEVTEAAGSHSDGTDTPYTYIESLWPLLTRQATTNTGSLIALPRPYVVPGGRFREQFYWDGYFIMLGLVESKRFDLIENMMKNYTYMIRKIGYIPTANRTYLLSRSQPPFFSHMVRLVASYQGKRAYFFYLPYLLKEYQFWMQGGLRLSSRYRAHKRAVRMPNGTVLNRYYDARDTPRPESYYEDIETAKLSTSSESETYRNLRAAAESGWDFSSRWLRDEHSLSTIHTTDIIPIDLNCLLYDLEMTISSSYSLLKQSVLAAIYRHKAEKRRRALHEYCWNNDTGLFHDYDYVADKQTKVESLASAYALYSGIASETQAKQMAARIRKDFLKTGGVVTTIQTTGQQWDAPNGWAPLQWVTIKGLERYGYNKLAETIRERWVASGVHVYHDRHKMIEKYDVENPESLGGGGEYEVQVGFGWTNGVLLALLGESPS